MNFDLELYDLPMPRIAGIRHAAASRTLQEITSRNLSRFAEGGESKPFQNRKEEMKQRLIDRDAAQTFEQVTDEDGRERLLISLYLEYAASSDASWLPAFDEHIAISVLGANSREWHAARRRQATQLFFSNFDQLPTSGLSHLCSLLLEAYTGMEQEKKGLVGQWILHRYALFTLQGPQSVARLAAMNETLPVLMERSGVPGNGRFTECLRQVFLLNAVKYCSLGAEIPELAEIASKELKTKRVACDWKTYQPEEIISEELKTKRVSASQLMGAAALQLMVQRVANEGGRKWSEAWSNWIIRLGCDPRYGRSTAEGAKWWGWATDEELRLAQQGITGRTLRFFIEYLRRSLQGTDKEPQFEMRSRFLLGLYDAGKIQSARLALNWGAYQNLDENYRDVWTVAHLSKTPHNTSMICLKCEDDIFVIEGTHSFGLRMFHRNFPVLDFWEDPKPTYQDNKLRISPGECSLYLGHDQRGKWAYRFFDHLRTNFHIEWDDVRF